MSAGAIGGTILGYENTISAGICEALGVTAGATAGDCTLNEAGDACVLGDDPVADTFCKFTAAVEGGADASCTAMLSGCREGADMTGADEHAGFMAVAASIDSLEEGIYTANAGMDSMWLLLGGSLVFFMHSGFALLEVGSVSVRNTQNILFKNVISPTVAAILFWAFGYSIAYGNGCGDGANAFIGSECFYFMTDVVVTDADGTAYDGSWYAGWFFQWAFCATASTIVSGTVAERIVFKVYVILTVFLTAFIYPVVVHWGWSADGWASAFNSKGTLLFGVGVVDFAGSGIVHMVGGVAAFVSAFFIGARHGRYVKQYQHTGKWFARTIDQPLVQMTSEKWMEIVDDDDSPSGETWKGVNKATLIELEKGFETMEFRIKANPFPCQSSTFQTFGCLILWFGWYGFNCVSTLAISGGYAGIAGKVAVTTTLAAGGGAISAGAMTYVIDGLQDLGSMSNGILAGLVSITSACSAVEPWAAIVIGMIGGVIYYFACKLLEAIHIDDVVLAIPVHCFCGMWGVMAVGLFASPQAMSVAYGSGGCGLFYAGHELCTSPGDQFLAQLVFLLAIIAWIVATVAPILFISGKILGAMAGWEYSDEHKTPLAYSASMQMLGMDEIKHGGMSGSETTTVYSQEPNAASTNSKNPTQGAVNPRKRRSSVVGQTVMPADEASA